MNKRKRAIEILEEKGINIKLLSRLLISPSRMNKDFGMSHDYKGKTFRFVILKEKVFSGIPFGPSCNNFVFFYNGKIVLQTSINNFLILERNFEIIKLSDWVEELPIVIDQIIDAEQQHLDKIIKENQNIDLGNYDE